MTRYIGKKRDFEIDIDCLSDKLFSKGWIITDFLGAGGVGEVFSLCQNQQNCTRVVKIETLHSIGHDTFEHEFDLLMMAQKYGIAPIVYDHWICHNVKVYIKDEPIRTIQTDVGFIVMDRWDGTCADFRTYCSTIDKKIVLDLAVKIDRFTNETGLYNFDIGSTNIFVKLDSDKKHIISVTCGDWNNVYQKPKNYTIDRVFNDLKTATGVNLMLPYYYQLYSKMKKN